MVTPQTTTTLKEIAQVILRNNRFVLCGHVSPDGDCLGSELGLAHALRKLGKEAVCLLAKDPVPENLAFLPGSEELISVAEYKAQRAALAPEVFIAVDVPTCKRLEQAAEIHDLATTTITIDHHANKESMAHYNYVDPDAPATCTLIWQLVKLLNAENEASAQCCLTGIITDTGRFSYQNTTPESLELAAETMRYGASPALVAREFFQSKSLAAVKLQQRMVEHMAFAANGAFAYSYVRARDFQECSAVKADAEHLIDELRSIKGVRVALILREETNPPKIRGSLRAKDETDVSQVARCFEGGGHKAAAGFSVYDSMDEAIVQATECVMRTCFPEYAGHNSVQGFSSDGFINANAAAEHTPSGTSEA